MYQRNISNGRSVDPSWSPTKIGLGSHQDKLLPEITLLLLSEQM